MPSLLLTFSMPAPLPGHFTPHSRESLRAKSPVRQSWSGYLNVWLNSQLCWIKILCLFYWKCFVFLFFVALFLVKGIFIYLLLLKNPSAQSLSSSLLDKLLITHPTSPIHFDDLSPLTTYVSFCEPFCDPPQSKSVAHYTIFSHNTLFSILKTCISPIIDNNICSS